MKNIHPRQPSHLSLYARARLDALVTANLADRISLGGALGLFHYLEYRPTHDVDAWWSEPLTEGQKQEVTRTLETTLADLVASKMVALVERGAPRDFLDIYTLCQAGLLNMSECWGFWRRRQTLSGSDADPLRARLAIETHLERIALHRPLEKIAEPEQREQARQLRDWYLNSFLQVKDE
jgi:hypothetical protein